MAQRGPDLQLRCDLNGNPISAKCSLCGTLMSQSNPRISDPMENVEWFHAQFQLHLA